MKRRNILGLFIIFLVILSIAVYQFSLSRGGIQYIFNPKKETINLSGYLGWEKRGLIQDPEVQKILKDKYGIVNESLRKGSIEMVTESTENKDYLFPSSKIALDIYKSLNTSKTVKSETILYSPIVVYSWKSLVDDLIRINLVQLKDNSYILDLPLLVSYVESGKRWEDIGATQLTGRISITSTDPAKSNSGNMFAALLVNIFNNGNVVGENELTPEILTRLKVFFDKMGYKDSSSGEIFEKFLNIGRSTYPFIIGYESQLIELINAGTPGIDKVVVLYTSNSVWSEHEFIAVNPKSEVLMEALKIDPMINKIAWERYGFRSINAEFDKTLYEKYNIAKEITNTIPLPTSEVMRKIIEYLD